MIKKGLENNLAKRRMCQYQEAGGKWVRRAEGKSKKRRKRKQNTGRRQRRKEEFADEREVRETDKKDEKGGRRRTYKRIRR